MARSPGRLLITGATGFIGRAAVQTFSAGPRPVSVVTRGAVDLPSTVRQTRIDSIGPATDWSAALRDCEVVLHLAGRAHVMSESATDPLAAYRAVNTEGTLALARAASQAGVRRFIFVSTVKVNGERSPDGAPFVETDPPAPHGGYAVSKAEAEMGLPEAAGPMEVVIVRPPLVHGPGVGANFSAMVRWLAAGYPLPLGAIRDNRRSLIGIDNLIDALGACIGHPAAAGQTFFVSDGEDVSTTDLLRRTAVAIGIRARLLPVPAGLLRSMATLAGRRSTADRLLDTLQVRIDRARNVLGWTPPISLDEGLRRAVQPLLESGGKRR